jgi:DMSO/TMAO reductase YedYZ molybdopterin-dependent catalytic subunit
MDTDHDRPTAPSPDTVSRRAALRGMGGAALASLSVLRLAGPTSAFQTDATGEVVPWQDQPDPNPVPENVLKQLQWEQLNDWVTPNDEFFAIKHFNLPTLDDQHWRLEVSGLVAKPTTLTLADLKARERREVTFTIECSGNTGLPFFTGGVGNATWAGTPLAPLLAEAGILDNGREVVFWGADAGEQTWRDVKITERFARSMSIADATSPDNLLAYEMNGEPLPPLHGFPLRLIAPGWYGIANVKWLTRIEVRDARYQGNFMARDYVTIREEARDGETVWTFTAVGRARLKSAPAKVTKQGDRYEIMGAAWGKPIKGVEVRIDDGAWQQATLTDGAGQQFAWSFWTLDWGTPAAGEHTITSRATAVDGTVQPAPDDPFLAGKTTFWESNGQITRRVRIA